jgi:hypothetical protein
MSEYHSFSLAQHLPSSTSLKKDAIQQQQPQEQYSFHTFNNDDILNCDTKHNVLNLNDSMVADHRPNNENGWTDHHQFQSLDAILNNAPYNHIRQNTATVNSNDFQPIFDFLPFHEPSHGLVMSNNGHQRSEGNTATINAPSLGGTSNFNVPIAFL